MSLIVRVLLPMVFCLVVMWVSAQSVEAETDQGAWRTVTPAPTQRTEVAAAALNGKIYVVGGFEEPSFGKFLRGGQI